MNDIEKCPCNHPGCDKWYVPKVTGMDCRMEKDVALLIAAAPDLLAALKSAKWMLERDFIDPQKLEIINKCEAAIKAANGEIEDEEGE